MPAHARRGEVTSNQLIRFSMLNTSTIQVILFMVMHFGSCSPQIVKLNPHQ